MLGQRFGRLTVIAYAGPRKKAYGTIASWLCLCDCGKKTTVVGPSLRRGMTKSCGCLWNEIRKAGCSRTHGATKTPEWQAYFAMRARCCNPKNKEFKNYGGRGIAVCDRWLKGDGNKRGIECFLEDMGERPSKEHTIDRIDVNGSYGPDNCCWATRKAQSRNKRNTVLDNNQTVSEIAAETGIGYHTLMDRYRRGDRNENLRRPVQYTKRWHIEVTPR